MGKNAPYQLENRLPISDESGVPRKTGIDIIGDVGWGTHFCQFYQTKQDLIDILVPYFKAGLESNEFCMWVTAEPLGAEEATQALRESVPDLDRRLAAGQMEIIPHTGWYLKDGVLDQQRVLGGWVRKLNEALAKGYAGLRLTGNTFWIEKGDWDDFTQYEEAVNSVIGVYRMLALCTYSVEKCGAGEIADVVANHEFALIKRHGQWTVIESSTARQAKQALQAALHELEDRARKLEQLNKELHRLNRTLKAHSKSDQVMMRATDESEYLREVCKNIVEDCGHAMVWIGYAENDEGKTVRPVAHAGFDRGYLKTLKVTWADTERGRGLTGMAIRTGKPSLCRNMLTDPRFEPWREEAVRRGYASSIVLPLMAEGKAFGAISIYSREPDPFSQHEVALLTELANDLAYGITAIRLRAAHARAEEELRRQTDLLTAVATNTTAHLVYLDRDFNFMWVNEAYARACARTQEEFIGHNHFDLYPHEENQAIFQRVRDTGIPFDVKEKPFVFPDHPEWGVTYWDWTLTPIKDSEGTVQSLVLSLMDVSEQVEFEKQKEAVYEREHRIAEVLQKALIPDTSYDIPGCEVAVRYEAALKEAEVGGDFYDLFDIGANKIGLLIGDVAGKGLAAAIQVAAARHSFRSYAYIDPRPGKVMTLVNDALSRDSREGITMLTAIFAIVDLEVGVVTYANGGHESPMLRYANGEVEELAVEGRALGVREGYEYAERSLILKPGDLVTMVTDGIVEARTNIKDMFGIERMKSYLSAKPRCSADELADGLLEAAKKHAGGALKDDAAILVFGPRKARDAR